MTCSTMWLSSIMRSRCWGHSAIENIGSSISPISILTCGVSPRRSKQTLTQYSPHVVVTPIGCLSPMMPSTAVPSASGARATPQPRASCIGARHQSPAHRWASARPEACRPAAPRWSRGCGPLLSAMHHARGASVPYSAARSKEHRSWIAYCSACDTRAVNRLTAGSAATWHTP
jgi:hypothetical protein